MILRSAALLSTAVFILAGASTRFSATFGGEAHDRQGDCEGLLVHAVDEEGETREGDVRDQECWQDNARLRDRRTQVEDDRAWQDHSLTVMLKTRALHVQVHDNEQ